ncbi:MAG: ATP-dependent Zn protease, partial [Alteromonas naphthalenivorans]
MKKKKNTFGSGGPRNILIVVVVMLLSLVILTKLVDDTRTKEELKYSQFMNMVEGKKVKSVNIDGSLITGIIHSKSEMLSKVSKVDKKLEVAHSGRKPFEQDLKEIDSQIKQANKLLASDSEDTLDHKNNLAKLELKKKDIEKDLKEWF